mgnify:FL=1
MDVSGRTTHMYKKYGIRVTQDAVTEEIKSSNYREILFLKTDTGLMVKLFEASVRTYKKRGE